jgi:post-segregation antitoxin (ccd killing protein)
MKVKLTLSVEDMLIYEAKKNSMNISKFVELKLAEEFGFTFKGWQKDSKKRRV